MLFSDLVKCEQELLECQRDLDDHKEECYGHMKVIQELKVATPQLQPRQMQMQQVSVGQKI